MATPKKKEESKSFSMRNRVEEVPRATVLGTDDSLRSKIQRNSSEDSLPENESFNKHTGVHKYLKMIKPLYVRASKIRIFDQLSPRKQGSPASVFRQVCGNSVKSRSAVGVVPVPASRRDDSALQQQDGIRSAILHCKRSYSSSSSSSILSQEFSMLSRSASDSSYQKALNPPRNSTEEEEKLSSI